MMRSPAGTSSVTQDTALDALPSWNLDDLYPGRDSPEFKRDLAEGMDAAIAFEARWKTKLAAAALAKAGEPTIGQAIAEYEALEDRLGRIISYAGLLYFSDTSNVDHAKFYGDVQAKLTDAGSHLLFFPLELNTIDDETMDRAMSADTLTAHYRPWILDLRKDKPYQLDERTEQLFHEKAMTGRNAWNRLFDETMTALRFDIDGTEMALEQTLNLFRDNIRTFTLITNTPAKDKEISDRWRGFEDIADSRHLANRVERSVVDALAQAVTAAYPGLSHRYYAMKARWLGMEQMEFWDRSAPLPDTPQTPISWDQARDMVLSAYHGFAPEMAAIARDFFDRRWIDAQIRPGKAPGAFAHPTVPSAHPYVLVNYMGKPRDVMTLAHELGHGVHQVLAGEQGTLMAATPLTLAETASVFGEMLTFRALLENVTDRRERKAMLAQKVEDMINTVVRQIAFYEFERRLHTARKEGELTSDDIGRLWLSIQTESLGPSVRISEGYETFWAYVPHFVHSPFYVYAYAFGDCLVNSLYAVYEQAETGFQAKYFDMLRAGGSKHHSELLAPFGLDASDPAFWNKGLAMIEGLIDELEALEAHDA
jgi:oligoendopeptidase F